MTGVQQLRRWALGISPAETSFARRGFASGDAQIQRHLETAGRAFVEGYNHGLAEKQATQLAMRLNSVEPMFRGFAFEGAAMAVALLDLVTPWNRRRFSGLLDTPAGDQHLYMLHVGAGWAIARVPWARRRFERVMSRFDPLYGWLALDGYGFHQGFFDARRFVEDQAAPAALSSTARRVFDQGLGRSLWFSRCGDPELLRTAIARFPAERHDDLWSGVGLGAAYAGGVDRGVYEQLREQAPAFAGELAQGAAFAAKARQRAGNPAPHTAAACEVFCHATVNEAAAVTDDCLQDLPADGIHPAYQVWRKRIRDHFAARHDSARPPRGRTTVRV